MVTQLSALPDESAHAGHETTPRSRNTTPRQIPWGYGRDRVTAMPVDPTQLFIYWEVRDDAIDAARGTLGPAGARAALVLRIYDTSGRIFDGTNAHSHFDQEIQRNDRQWFCHVGKPASSAHVELGVRAHDGRFARIMRSGRVDFPRVDPAPWRAPEWMRVVATTGEIAFRETSHVQPGGPGGAGSPEAFGDGGGSSSGADGGGGAELVSSFEAQEFESYELSSQDVERWEFDTGWLSDPNDPESTYRFITASWQEIGFGISSWETGPMESSWEAGPFQFPTEVVVPTAERFEGPTHVYRVGEQVRVLHGPWQVVIRGIQPRSSRRVLARWEIHRSWVSASGRAPDDVASLAPGQRVVRVGASERHALSASELRLRGASEVFYLGASERRFMGASETRFVAASQWIARGASERSFKGASEWRLMGASERRFMGASERRLMGASERRFVGASERRLGGASERRPGASERRLEGEGTKLVTVKG